MLITLRSSASKSLQVKKTHHAAAVSALPIMQSLCNAIVRHDIRTYESAGVVEVIEGRQNAETTMRQFEDGQSSEDRQAGWRYFLEKTRLKAGMDPAKATHLRQTDLEIREPKAPQK